MRVRIDTIKNNSETALKVAVLYTHLNPAKKNFMNIAIKGKTPLMAFVLYIKGETGCL